MPGGLQPAQLDQSLSQRIQQSARRHGFILDAAQSQALVRFERLYSELTDSDQAGRSLLSMFLRQRPVRGLYLWGGVGRGKSFLMDAFFDAVSLDRKRRVHFHRFMQDIHHRLKAVQGAQNPLLAISRDIARAVRLLCLDEFHVADIGDAMLMRNLLHGLFDHGVVLVTSSNQHPDALYLHGLQRAQFLPAIELLKSRLEVVEVDGGTDYRLRLLEKGGVYHFPLDSGTESAMTQTFEAVAGAPGERAVELEIDGRPVAATRVASGVAWFEFAALCDGPRGQADYIELARRFHTVLISGLRRFGPADGDKRRRFTWLVDEFYDRRVKLILSAEARLHDLFRSADDGTEAQRTLSRLTEMQTRRYLSEPHLS